MNKLANTPPSTLPRSRRQAARSRRTPRAVWLSLAAVALGWISLNATLQAGIFDPKDDYSWYAYSSGNMGFKDSPEKGPGLSKAETVIFSCVDNLPGDYWVGSGVEFKAAKAVGTIEMDVRKTTVDDRAVQMRMLDSKGSAAYFEIAPGADWSHFVLHRDHPTHAEGAPLVDIVKVEFILNNIWYHAGDKWSVDVANIKTSDPEDGAKKK